MFLRRVPAVLANDVARARIHSLAAGLPFLTAGGFECRLDDGDDEVDFHVAILPASEAFRDRRDHAAWQLLAAVRDAAHDPQSSFHKTIEELILEFDLHGDVRGDEAPSVFMTLAPNAGQNPSAVRAIVRQLGTDATHAVADTCLTRLFAALPDAGRIAQAGVMHREEPQLRLNIADLRPEIAVGVIQRYAPHLSESVANAMRQVNAVIDWVQLTIDVSSEPMQRVGIEYFLRAQPAQEPRWRELVDRLIAIGACSSEKARAILAWPGVIQRQDVHEWPARIDYADRLMSTVASSIFVCRINHIKLTVAQNGGIRAKAYPSFSHQWLTRADAKQGAQTAPAAQ